MRIGTSQTPNFRCLQTILTVGMCFLPKNSRDDYNVIMKHLWAKVQSKPKEWRRIYKALYAMDYLIKNGAPRVV